MSSISIIAQPASSITGDGSFPVDNGTSSINCIGVDDLGTTVEYQWQSSSDSGSNWTSVTNTNGFSGATTDTLTVPDRYELDGYQFRCILNSATATSSVTSDVSIVDITLVPALRVLWTGITTGYATGTLLKVTIDASVSDGSTPVLSASYATAELSGVESGLVSTSYGLVNTGEISAQGYPIYSVRLAENRLGAFAQYKSDDASLIKITATAADGSSVDASSLFDDTTVPCISIIDENSNQNQATVDADWTSFRNAWPDRPFNILHVATPSGSWSIGTGGSDLTLPSNAVQGVDYDYYQIYRDNGDPITPSGSYDWFTLTGIDTLPPGATVALFIDNSGSMSVGSVGSQLDEFESDCAAAGINIIRVYDGNERMIRPFITELVVDIPSPLGGEFAVEPAYSVSQNLQSEYVFSKQEDYTLSVSFSQLNTEGISPATTLWYYKNPGSVNFFKLTSSTISQGLASWYVSGLGTGNLVVNFEDESFDEIEFYAVGYNDFASSGVDDTNNIAQYSAVPSAVTTIRVSPFSVSAIDKIPGVTPEETLSKTTAAFNASEYILTITSDNLPDPAEFGIFPHTYNTNTLESNSFIHSIRYRGGTNTAAVTESNLGALGILVNGTPIYGSNVGSEIIPTNSIQSSIVAPTGFHYSYEVARNYYGVDQYNGYIGSDNIYRYHTADFLSSSSDSWIGIAGSNDYFRSGSYSGDNFRHSDGHSKIIGIAFDGHPIYGPFGYSSSLDSSSSATRMRSSYVIRTTPLANRGATFAQIPAGTYIEDYQYISGSGDLDPNNGRYCVTPEYPNGTYAYFVTLNEALTQSVYPYIFGPSLRQAYYQVGGIAVTDPGGNSLQGPTNNGFDIRKVFTTGITVQAKTGSNTRRITSIESSAAADPVSYQWQRSLDNVSWFNIQESESAYSNVNSNILTISDVDSGIDDNYIRLKVTDSNSDIGYSSPMALQYVGSLISITTQPSNVTTLAGKPITFSIAATSTDNSTLNYLWEASHNGGVTWNTLDTYEQLSGGYSGETTSTLSLARSAVSTSVTGFRFRCVVDSTSADNSGIVSDTAILTVNAASFTTNGAFRILDGVPGTNAGPYTINEGQAITFYADIIPSNSENLTATWEKTNDNGTTWTVVSSQTVTSTTSYRTSYTEIPDTTVPLFSNSYWQWSYRVRFSQDGVTSNSTQVSNSPIVIIYRTSSISLQPANKSVYETEDALFSVSATVSSGTPTYQWQENLSGVWSDLVGETSSTLTITNPSLSDNNRQFRVNVSLDAQSPSSTPPRAGNTTTSDAATLLVYTQPTLSISVQPVNATVFQPDSTIFSVTADSSDGSPIFYQWQVSADTGSTWNNIDGATSSSVSTGSTESLSDNGSYYRCVISHPYGANSPLTSNYGILTVNTPIISISQQPSSVSTTAGVPVIYDVIASVTSSKTISYQWQLSTDAGGNWANIAGETSYQFSVIGDTGNNGHYFRCILSSLGADDVTSATASLSLAYLEDPTINTSRFVDSSTGLTFTRSPIIYSSFFRSYVGNAHQASYWIIRKADDNSLVYQTSDTMPDGDTDQKVELQAPVLEWGTQYSVQVRFVDADGIQSTFSTPVVFTTPVVNQPTFQPIPGSLRPTIVLNNLEFNFADYNHSSTDWQVAKTGNFAPADVVYESLNDASNKTSITIPLEVTLEASRNYYVRARINLLPV